MTAGALSEDSHPREEVDRLLSEAKARNLPWQGPRMFRPSYFAGHDVLEVATAAYDRFASDNWLYGRTSYPALGEFEDDILDTLYDLFHAPAGAGGILTSGGTESLIEAIHIARDKERASASRREPYNIVLPHTAHPAFDKGAHLLDVDVRRAPSSHGVLADVGWMTKACDESTILLVGSAPPYPFGQVDPIADLAALARTRQTRLHVDACLGGMILPFSEMLGRQPPLYDFRVQGIHSLSVDLHKFGYSAKGISALLLDDADDAQYARTVFTDWPAGMYGTPSISGTRPGGALASAWAVMRYLGRKGFVERTKQIFDIRDAIIMGLRDIGAETIGTPDCYHFNFAMPDIDNLVLADQLTKDGWIVSSTERPKTVQLMITAAHSPSVKPFVQAVKAISAEIRAGRRDSTGTGSVYSKVVVKPRIAKGAAARASECKHP